MNNLTISGNSLLPNDTYIEFFFYNNDIGITSKLSTMCNTKKLIAIVSIGPSKIYEIVKNYFGRHDILTIHIPTDIEYGNETQKGVLLTHYNDDYANLVIQMVKLSKRKKLGLFFRNDISENIDIFITKMTNMASLNGISVSLLNYMNENPQSLKEKMTKYFKGNIYTTLFLTNDTEFLMNIVNLAREANIIQQNYYWIIEGSKINHTKLLSNFLTSDKPCFIVIRSNLYQNIQYCNNCSVYQQPLEKIINIIVNQITQMGSILASMNSGSSSCNNDSEFRKSFKSLIFKNHDFQVLLRKLSIYDLYSTKSIDTTFDQISKFTYSTNFTFSGHWTRESTNDFDDINKFFPNVFNGWDNKTIYICTPTITPAMVILGDGTYVTIDETIGLVPEILKKLSILMNFRMLLYKSPDDQFGSQIGNSSNFTGCIGQVLMKNAVFAASTFTFTYQRASYIDFTYPIMEESNTAVLQIPPPEAKTWHVYRPIQWTAWILLFISVFIVALFCHSFSKFSPLSAWNLKLEFAIIDEISLKEHVWNTVGGFFMQGQDFYPYAMSARTILAVWWLFVVIVFSAYTADLTSFLTVSIPTSLISNLAQLAARNDLTILLPNGTNVIPLLGQSPNPTYQKLYARSALIDTVDDCIKKITYPTSTNLVCITDTSAVTYIVNRYCSVIYPISQTFNTAPLGFVVPKDSPFKGQMDNYIRTLSSTGIITKWIGLYWTASNVNPVDCNPDRSSSSAQSVGLDGVLGAFILVWILFGLALMIFVFEILYKHCHLRYLHSS